MIVEDVLDDTTALEAADPDGMLRAVATSGAQLRAAQAAATEAGVAELASGGRPRALVVAGMGGSGVGGDVLAAVLGDACPVPVVVHRGFGLPGWVGATDLVAAVSCSGTTEETLSAAEEAVRRGSRLLTVGAAGTALAAVAEQGRAPHVVVPSGRQPRAALWELTGPLLVTADALGLGKLPSSSFERAADRLDTISEACRPGSETFANPAKSLAVDLRGSIPLLWGSSRIAAVAAYRFSCQLAENAAYPSIPGELPEAGHNQVVTVEGAFASGDGKGDHEADFFRDRVDDPVADSRLHAVVLRDSVEHPRVAARREAVTEIAREHGVPVSEVVAEGSDALERAASLIGLTDYVSVYLALLLGVDPTPVKPLTDLKSRVAQ